MGLDMHLKASRRLNAFEPNEQRQAYEIQALFPGLSLEIEEVQAEAMYWRKDWPIHRWFVEHVQGGKDDCGEYGVGRETLQKLAEACEAAAKKPRNADPLVSDGNEILPKAALAARGERLAAVAAKLRALLGPELEGWHFSYRSSW